MLDDLLKTDPMLAAEEITGKSYKDDEGTCAALAAVKAMPVEELRFELGTRRGAPSETFTGTTVTVRVDEYTGNRIVVLDNPRSAADLRMTEAGRIIAGGFQPVGAVWAATAPVLRAIADLIDDS